MSSMPTWASRSGARLTNCGSSDTSRGRHHEKAGRGLEVEGFGARDGVEVLLGDRGQRHVVDVHTLAGDEMQEEVDGPLEDFELHLVRHLSSVPTSLFVDILIPIAPSGPRSVPLR